MDTPSSSGEWLKQRRKALDLTQEELAEWAGCSIFAVRMIETGERKPSKQLAGLLAAALEIPKQEQPLFIQVARGDIRLERLRVAKPTSPRYLLAERVAVSQQFSKSRKSIRIPENRGAGVCPHPYFQAHPHNL